MGLGSTLIPLKDVFFIKAESEEQATLTQAKLGEDSSSHAATSEVAGVKSGSGATEGEGRCRYCRRTCHKRLQRGNL